MVSVQARGLHFEPADRRTRFPRRGHRPDAARHRGTQDPVRSRPPWHDGRPRVPSYGVGTFEHGPAVQQWAKNTRSNRFFRPWSSEPPIVKVQAAVPKTRDREWRRWTHEQPITGSGPLAASVDDVLPHRPMTDIAATSRKSSRWRGLDGLRAFAVLLVLACHFGFHAQGGIVGVDVFFVLSGFLITSLLLKERDKTGQISYRDFWARRAYRLFPRSSAPSSLP